MNTAYEPYNTSVEAMHMCVTWVALLYMYNERNIYRALKCSKKSKRYLYKNALRRVLTKKSIYNRQFCVDFIW